MGVDIAHITNPVIIGVALAGIIIRRAVITGIIYFISITIHRIRVVNIGTALIITACTIAVFIIVRINRTGVTHIAKCIIIQVALAGIIRRAVITGIIYSISISIHRNRVIDIGTTVITFTHAVAVFIRINRAGVTRIAKRIIVQVALAGILNRWAVVSVVRNSITIIYIFKGTDIIILQITTARVLHTRVIRPSKSFKIGGRGIIAGAGINAG
jgi:hypothetical protein